jgi:hypothetical protein
MKYLIDNVEETHQFGIMTWQNFQLINQVTSLPSLQDSKLIYVFTITKFGKFLRESKNIGI